MEFFAQKLREYKSDILPLTLLLSVFLLLCSLFFAHQSNPNIDIGREAYVPFEMLKGQTLYKDIIAPFPPLSYQLNSFVFLVFGASIDTLYYAGALNTLIILFTLYLIARNLTTPVVSAVIVYSVMSFACFSTFIFSYLFPYTFGVVYALSAFLLSALFLIRYLKNSNPWFVVISSFFISLSIMFKYEFIPFLTVLVYLPIFYKPIPRKYLLYCIIAGLTVPFFAFLQLFLQGLALDDLVKILGYVKNYSLSNEYKFFLSNYAGFYCSTNALINVLLNFVKTVSSLSILMIMLYGFIYVLNKIPSRKILFKISKYLIFLVFFFLLPKPLFSNTFSHDSYSWLPLFTLILFFVSIRIYLKNKTKKNEIFCFVTLTALLGTCKSFFGLNLVGYGAFFIPLLLLVNIIFSIEYFPTFFKFIDISVWKKAFIALIISSSFLFSFNKVKIMREELIHPVKSEKGTIYTTKIFADTLNKGIDYINKNIPENKTFLMFPECANLNFFTGRSSNNKWFLDPARVKAYGEQNIVEDLRKNPPDYIFLTNLKTESFGPTYFCKDYAQEICRFMFKNYEYQTDFGREFQIVILKKK